MLSRSLRKLYRTQKPKMLSQIKTISDRASDAEDRLTKLEHMLSTAAGISKDSKAACPIVHQSPGFPEWTQPSGSISKLKVLNSLCPTMKVDFIPQNGNTVNWYQCGPTTYAPAHLGHARAYVTFDILRRLLEDYFGYNVNFVENITDVDDKIIKRARQNYLLAQYQQTTTDPEQIKKAITEAFAIAKAKHDKTITEKKEKVATAKGQALKTAKAQLENEDLKRNNTKNDEIKFLAASTIEEVWKFGGSVLADKIDNEKGHTVTDNSIFRAHAEKFEIEFMEDMRSLNVRDPDVLTRVTEYIENIVDYVKKIIDNGYAYATEDGDVYFDVLAFAKTHSYGKLDPNSVGDIDLLMEGEGSLTGTQTKRNARDFALWKSSKPGEPSWDSPWGKGRPGWHIECSAMSSDVLGAVLDIHTGGEDLKFPHHDNEMAQSEAYYSNPCKGYHHQQWVNYWFHAGHLHIHGLKMSKSLKNFVSIGEMMNVFTMRQIRIFFSLQSWHAKMHYTDETLIEAIAKERQLRDFFMTVRSFERELADPSVLNVERQKWSKTDKALNEAVMKCMTEVDNAFRDNFDYQCAMMSIFELMKEANIYMLAEKEPKVLLINKAADFINKVLKVLGVVADNETHFLGRRQTEMEKALAPMLDLIIGARNDIMTQARLIIKDKSRSAKELLKLVDPIAKKLNEARSATPSDIEIAALFTSLADALENFLNVVRSAENVGKDVFPASDKLRDEDLYNLGVQAEDAGARSCWKLYVPAKLLHEKKEEEGREQRRAKLGNQLQQKDKELKKWHGYEAAVQELEAKYSEEELGKLKKNQMKKHNKALSKAKKNQAKLEKELKKNANFLTDLECEVANLKKELDSLSGSVL